MIIYYTYWIYPESLETQLNNYGGFLIILNHPVIPGGECFAPPPSLRGSAPSSKYNVKLLVLHERVSPSFVV